MFEQLFKEVKIQLLLYLPSNWHLDLVVDLRMMNFREFRINCRIWLYESTFKDYQVQTQKTHKHNHLSNVWLKWRRTWKTHQCKETSPSSKLISHNRKSVKHLTTTDHRWRETQFLYRAVLVTYIGLRTAWKTAALHLSPSQINIETRSSLTL